MRSLAIGYSICAVLFFAAEARAGYVLEASLGKGLALSPEVVTQPSSLMIAPGVALTSVVRVQLGIELMLPDGAWPIDASTGLGTVNGRIDLSLRPMITLSVPRVPLHGRLVAGLTNLTDDTRRAIAYGVTIGISGSWNGVGLFAELGLLPRGLIDRYIDGQGVRRTWWILEARSGVSFGL